MSKLKGLDGSLVKSKKGPTEPVWKGPEEDGITFSMLSQFLQCRERFRVKYVQGIRPEEKFNKSMEYGNIWHEMEEAHAHNPEDTEAPVQAATRYSRGLLRRFPAANEEINKWFSVAVRQFPLYVHHWRKHPHVVNRSPLLEEWVMSADPEGKPTKEQLGLMLKLPSGRWIKLMGKLDSVDQVKKGKRYEIWLQENKTKGDINEGLIQRQLRGDLQTMMYMTALSVCPLPVWFGANVSTLKGVRYNVVRRPLAGGKHSIRQRKDEGKIEFFNRLQGLIQEEPDHYFMRWEVEITQGDIDRFCSHTLYPLLEQLCDWYEWVSPLGFDPFSGAEGGAPNTLHWQHPFGVRNWMDEGGSDDLDEYLETGSMVGMQRSTRLFSELGDYYE